MFSGNFYISYQVFIAVRCLEVPVYRGKRDSLDLEKFRPVRRAVVLRLAGAADGGTARSFSIAALAVMRGSITTKLGGNVRLTELYTLEPADSPYRHLGLR